MKTVAVIQTFDGKLHYTQRDARHHLDVLLGNVMLPLAHKLIAAEKYKAVTELLNSSTETFRQIIQIQDDMKLEHDDSES